MTDDELRAWLAGLDGVTPGPWSGRIDSHFILGDEDSEGLWTQILRSSCRNSPVNSVRFNQWVRDRDHIARCDPQTIRALIYEVLAGRERNGAGVDELPDPTEEERIRIELVDGMRKKIIALEADRDLLRAENARLREELKIMIDGVQKWISAIAPRLREGRDDWDEHYKAFAHGGLDHARAALNEGGEG